jgi:hypothetical protein
MRAALERQGRGSLCGTARRCALRVPGAGMLCTCMCLLLTGVLWTCVQLQDDRRSEAARGSALVSFTDPRGLP